MRLAIHQPEFMPWSGYFYKMALADRYIVLDHVQFKKRYFENRNRVVSPKEDISYIRVPVKTKGSHFQSIRDVEIDNTQNWQGKLLGTLQHYYNRAPYFNRYFEEMHSLIYARDYIKLFELNMEFIGFCRKHLGISTPIVFSSSLNVDYYKASDLILQLCILNNAKIYLCGASGKDYLQQEDFGRKGVRIEWIDYESPVYAQLGANFVKNLSALDLLFNHGERSRDILLKKKT